MRAQLVTPPGAPFLGETDEAHHLAVAEFGRRRNRGPARGVLRKASADTAAAGAWNAPWPQCGVVFPRRQRQGCHELKDVRRPEASALPIGVTTVQCGDWAVTIMKSRLHGMTLETLIQRRDSLPYGDKRIADIDREIALRVRAVFNPAATNGKRAQAIERRVALEQILAPWR